MTGYRGNRKALPLAGVVVRKWGWLLFLGLITQGLMAPAAEPQRGHALVVRIDGPIGPAQAAYVEQGVKTATEQGAAAIILSMDTPGGLDTAMRDIIRVIFASPLPVLTYVSPSGARAASAGTYILYASHIAAMAPGTNLGAATPVAIGGGLPLPGGRDKEPSPAEDGKKPAAPAEDSSAKTMEAKAVNDAVAYIRALAELRGRNAEWAEKAVREAASLPASAALAQKVIDLMPTTLDQLLADADGRTVTLNDRQVQLQTAGLAIAHFDPDWRTQFLAAITNPNVALILMMIGIYGLIFEFMSPGAIYPGTIGAICLLIALYALGTLPVNYAGVGLILLGIALMIGEAFAPSFGILGIGGAIAFVLGATIMFDSDIPGFEISWAILLTIIGASLLFALLVVPLVIAAYRRPVATGQEDMLHKIGDVLEWSGTAGQVFVHGERWRAVSDTPLAVGQKVRIIGLDGLTLKVQSASSPPSQGDRR